MAVRADCSSSIVRVSSPLDTEPPLVVLQEEREARERVEPPKNLYSSDPRIRPVLGVSDFGLPPQEGHSAGGVSRWKRAVGLAWDRRPLGRGVWLGEESGVLLV